MALRAGSVPMSLVRSVALHGGDVLTTWKVNGLEVRAAGMRGSQVALVRAGRDSASAWVAPPSAAAVSAARYARSGRSVYWDALGAGMSKAEAVKLTLALGDRLPVAAHVNATPATPDIHNIFYSSCATVWETFTVTSTGSPASSSPISSPSRADYLNNQVTTSGASNYTVPLVQLKGSYCWCGNGYTYTRVGWSPSATINEGNPTTYTLTAGGAGFSASIQETQYPQSLSPIFPSGVNEPAFGSEWQGSNANGTVDSANSVAIVHEGPGAPGPAIVKVSITWNGTISPAPPAAR